MSERKATKSSPWIARLGSLCLSATARLPLSWLRAWGRALGGLASRIPNQQRAITELNLKLCFPELEDPERQRLARASLQQTAITALELGPLWRLPPARLAELEAETEGGELLEDALAAGKGVVLLSPHLGNWEMLNHFLMRRAQLVTLYRPPRIAEVDRIVRQARGRTGCISAPPTHGGVRRVLEALRGGELLLILPDQEPLKSHGVFAPFFGLPALTMTLVSRILRRTGARPVFVFAERQADGRFRVVFQAPPEGLDGDDEVAAATRLNQGVEACVRRCPEQYLWAYKRFKTTPPGETTPYRAIWTRRQTRRNRGAPSIALPPRRRRHAPRKDPAGP